MLQMRAPFRWISGDPARDNWVATQRLESRSGGNQTPFDHFLPFLVCRKQPEKMQGMLVPQVPFLFLSYLQAIRRQLGLSHFVYRSRACSERYRTHTHTKKKCGFESQKLWAVHSARRDETANSLPANG